MKNIFSIDKSCQNEVVTLQRQIGLRLGIIEKFNNFLVDYRFTFNNAPLVSMGEESVKNKFEHCSKAGFMVLEGLSREQICEIIEILKETKFSFMPIYRKLDSGGETPLFE